MKKFKILALSLGLVTSSITLTALGQPVSFRACFTNNSSHAIDNHFSYSKAAAGGGTYSIPVYALGAGRENVCVQISSPYPALNPTQGTWFSAQISTHVGDHQVGTKSWIQCHLPPTASFPVSDVTFHAVITNGPDYGLAIRCDQTYVPR